LGIEGDKKNQVADKSVKKLTRSEQISNWENLSMGPVQVRSKTFSRSRK